MSHRITRKDLDHLCATVNRMRGVPEETYTREEDGTYTLNPDTLSISGAYGGWDVVIKGGGRSLLGGHGPAREAYYFLRGMVEAYEMLLPRDQYGRVTTWDVTLRAEPRD